MCMCACAWVCSSQNFQFSSCIFIIHMKKWRLQRSGHIQLHSCSFLSTVEWKRWNVERPLRSRRHVWMRKQMGNIIIIENSLNCHMMGQKIHSFKESSPLHKNKQNIQSGYRDFPKFSVCHPLLVSFAWFLIFCVCVCFFVFLASITFIIYLFMIRLVLKYIRRSCIGAYSIWTHECFRFRNCLGNDFSSM